MSKVELIKEIVKVNIQLKGALHNEDYETFQELREVVKQLEQQLH